jgi:hypothetical protein
MYIRRMPNAELGKILMFLSLAAGHSTMKNTFLPRLTTLRKIEFPLHNVKIAEK